MLEHSANENQHLDHVPALGQAAKDCLAGSLAAAIADPGGHHAQRFFQ